MKKILVILLFIALIAGAVIAAGHFFPKLDTNPPVNGDPEVRYTVTEEEWNTWTTYENYTIKQNYGKNGEYSITNKYTEYALQFEDGTIILFIEDKQYQLEKTEEGYAAYDCTALEYSHSGLLSGGYVYDEFAYNEETGAYVLDMIEEIGSYWEVRFKNGVPVGLLYNEYTDGEVSYIISNTYTNVGTTVIDVPDYEIQEGPIDNTRREVTEEEWNIGVATSNHTGSYYSFIDGTFESYSYQCVGNAYEINGVIYVVEGGKTYELVENEGIWTAVEIDSSSTLVPTVLPQEFKYEDFEFSTERSGYIPKEGSGIDLNIIISFSDGQILFISTQGSLDPNDAAYANAIIFDIKEIGNAVIEIPDYVIAE